MPDAAFESDALDILRALTGRRDAAFHPGQLEAVEALVERGERALVVQRTGWGKSAVYFVATMLRRRRGSGPTLLISPLLALMRDQVSAAERAGVRAVAINSATVDDWADTSAALARDEIDVLLVSPERLSNPRFRDEELPALRERCGLLVVDEAHCISDWGHDFRPDYRRIADLIEAMPAGVPVLATTATANSRVVEDVAEQLGSAADGAPVTTIRGSLARDSLRLGVLQLEGSERVAWLVQHLGSLPGSGIVYALTVSAAEDTARALRDAGMTVAAYTGRTDPEERRRLEDELKANRVKALVATSALGMGFDKPDLGFVVHLGAPSSPVAYYQQVGRAGRGAIRADVLLLPGPEDAEIWSYFATASMPDERRAEAVLGALGPEPRSTQALEARVDVRRTQLELLLKVLDVDGAVSRVRGGWVGTGQAWHYDAERYERIAAERVAEQQAMRDYVAGERCRMRFLQESLDDTTAADCGRCDVCTAPWYPTSIDAGAADAARAGVDRVGVPVDPRAQWPSGLDRRGVTDADGAPLSGKIRPGERVDEGRALARLTDIGWGGPLRRLLAAAAEDQPVPRGVADAAVRVLAEWGWATRPVAVVSMPSRRRPQLVESTARHLAGVGRLPYLGALAYAGDGPTGGPGGNSASRVAAVHGRVVVPPELAAAIDAIEADGPVLLVDDLVDSRWTMTIAGRELRGAGAGGVLPFALALAG